MPDRSNISRTGCAPFRQKATFLNSSPSTHSAMLKVARSTPPTQGQGMMCAIVLRVRAILVKGRSILRARPEHVAVAHVVGAQRQTRREPQEHERQGELAALEEGVRLRQAFDGALRVALEEGPLAFVKALDGVKAGHGPRKRLALARRQVERPSRLLKHLQNVLAHPDGV